MPRHHRSERLEFAPGARLDARAEVAPERRILLLNAAQDVLDAPLHVDARALDVRRRLAASSAQANRSGELLDESVNLCLGALGAGRVAEAAGFFEDVAQVREAGAVPLPGLVV